jgi:polyisoprenoid-binding protein YceI
MTNYLAMLTAVTALFAGACSAAEPPAAKPATTRPATPPPAAGGARISTAPAGTAGSAARFTQAPGTGSLTFSFMQAGAENRGSFRQFATELVYDAKNPTAGSLKVTVQTASLETQDKDRNDTLAGADLFDVKKYPTAQYVANSFAKRADGQLEAIGKLTLRGVTKDLRVPLNLRAAGDGYELSGEVTVARLDFGVGQGEWQSTEWVGNEVKLQYKVPLVRAQ